MQMGTVGSFKNGKGYAFVFERAESGRGIKTPKVHLELATQGRFGNDGEFRKLKPGEKPEEPVCGTRVKLHFKENPGQGRVAVKWVIV